MPVKHKTNDSLYDIEAFENVFTNAFWYPKTRLAVLDYISDSPELGMNNPEIQEQIITEVVNFFEDPEEINPINKSKFTFNNLNTIQGAVNFIQRVGVASTNTYYNRNHIDHYLTDNNEYTTSLYRLGQVLGLKPHWFYPIKDTEKEFDPKNPKCGFFYGYNSTNYDETMMAIIAYELATTIHTHIRHKTNDDIYNMFKNNEWLGIDIAPTAKTIREAYNDRLFNEYKSNMPDILKETGPRTESGYIPKDWDNDKVNIRKAWRLTNRHIDVARLNEKLAKVGLKRVMAYLGLPIIEADTSNNIRVESINDLISRIIYNFSDIINLNTLLQHKAYAVPYDLHIQLLKRYPQTIYLDNGEGKDIPDVKPEKIRKNRLTIDSTSAKFVEFIVSPYSRLKDDKYVSFLYPSKTAIQRLKREKGIDVKQVNILDQTKEWFEKHVTNDPSTEAHKSFMNVINFYKSIEGKNFNAGKAYQEYYLDNATDEERTEIENNTKDNDYIKKKMEEFNTNLFYYKKDLTPSSCYATLSIGGIHGAEIHEKRYKYDCSIVKSHNRVIDEIRSLTENGTVLEALQLKPRITLKNGREIKVRDYIKNPKLKLDESNMKKEHPHGEWKYKTDPKLFSLKKKKGQNGATDSWKWELADKYKYVSVGEANHEDFASYYPLLLSMLSAFENLARGYDENGEPIDIYYQLFQTRIQEKEKANDESLPDDVRALANLVQNLMKLLINAASGVGDGKFDTNIRVNNKVIAMRIIGQLFAWRIGQAQTLAGARVPSTNTDGLYTMDISFEENNKILFETVEEMYIDIEPELLTNFVSKDSNNRLEAAYKKKLKKEIITSARGGTLTSWQGPEPTNNLDHPAMTDRILAEYLWQKENAVNQHFDREFARKLYNQFILERLDTNEGRFEVTRFLQWIMASSTNSHRYIYQKRTIQTENETKTVLEQLQHYNRAFLVKKEYINTIEQIENKPITTQLETIVAAADKQKPKENQADAIKIHKLNGYIAENESKYSKTMKVSKLRDNVTVLIDNESQKYKCRENNYYKNGQATADFFKHVIDHEAYIDLIEDAFENSWYNKNEYEF